MKAAPSVPFRRLCLAMALLATTWALPNRVQADAYALQTVKGIADKLKPNVLIVLETAESMQGLPGENGAAYNEVGADCENGNRHCRLVGQNGRWVFSGMGKNGVFFGSVPASCTSTSTYTYPVTITTNTSSVSSTTTQTTITTTTTASGTQSATGTTTASNTATGSGTTGATGTATASGSANGNWTATGSNSAIATGTNTATATAAGASQVIAGTGTLAGSVTQTATGTVTLTGTITAIKSATLTGTVTATKTAVESGTIAVTETATESATVTVTGSITSTGNVTVNGTANATGTISQILTVTLSGGQTATNTGTSTVTTTVSKSTTATASLVSTASTTALGTKTVTQTTTVAGTTTGTATATATATGTVTATASQTATASVTALVTGGGTANNTAYVTSTPGGTSTYTTTATYSATSSALFTWKLQGTGTFHAQNTDSGTSVTWVSVLNPGTLSATGSITAVTTSTDSAARTQSGTTTQTITTTASATQPINSLSFTYTSGTTNTSRSTTTLTGTATWTSTASLSFVGNWTGTGTSTGTFGSTTATTTSTTTLTTTLTSTHANTGTACGTMTGSATVTETGTVTGTPTVTGTGTITGSASATGTGSVTATAVLAAGGTMTGSTIVTATGTVTGTVSATGTATAATTTTTTTTTSVTTTYTVTATAAATGTETISTCGFQGNTDPNACNPPPNTTAGYCNYASGYPCTSDGNCTTVKGDFCRAISSLDGSGRMRNETCPTSAGSPWGQCKQGLTTANTPCASGDTSCGNALPGDYCAEGVPADMCADSGLWCTTNADCPGSPATDTCVPATSRLMTVKRALRRAVTDYADHVNFGFMNSYQGRGIPSTATDAGTAIFPYVKLQSCPGSANATETRLLTRGELEKAGCFTLAAGPNGSCTVDYGGGGTVNSNAIAYSLVGSNDSRWSIPRSDGTGKYSHLDASWSTCSASPILPACVFDGQGTALYEGSYYSFSFKQGTPIANNNVDGEGSMKHPSYFTSYMGKYYFDGSNCYNAIDAQRTDIVNDGIFGRVAYTGHPYDSANEISVPWAGPSSATACGATTGAVWNSAAVPFLNDTTLTRSQKALITAGRLDKASFGGVDATGALNPLACQLSNDGAPDRYHSAAHYMAAVQSSDATNNSNHTPCWSNNIILVVDGQADGYGDMGSNIDCASTQCAYNAATNTTLAGCSCAAITKAYSLARSGVQTHVVVNAPASWSTRFVYTNAFLTNLAIAGSPNFNGTLSYGTTEDEVYKAISDKIAAATYQFVYPPTAAVAGATTQDPVTQILVPSTSLYHTTVDFPSGRGNVQAFDTAGGVTVKWNAAMPALPNPDPWTNRKIFFSSSTGTVAQVNISSLGVISNAGDLHTAGLGSSADEAALIMQWLLGKPTLNNPAPLIGSTSASTPIVVGQPAANGLNGSTAYSQDNYLRPQLVYVGGDDGMLHAFFADKKPDNAGGSWTMGEEAFAFIPNDMLPVINKLYAQGGQLLAPDKGQHIFGLASSPKVKDMCIGSSCQTSTGSGWHTVLVMTEGPGGNSPFALDITDVIKFATGPNPSALKLLWSAPLTTDATKWDRSLGETTSVPAFYFAGYVAGTADNRVIMASGYPNKFGSNYGNQGLVIVNAVADTGEVKEYPTIPSSSLGCTQKRTVMADVVLARDYSSAATSQYLMSAYVSDTWGNTYQYLPGSTPSLIDHRGCGQPIHYAPAVVQLDRAPKADTSSKHFIYLAQVTNSNLDPDTQLVAGVYKASQIVVTKLDGNITPPAIVASYGSAGQITLSADTTGAPNTYPICIQTTNSGTGTLNTFGSNVKTAAQSCADAGGIALPTGARPSGTPTAILRSDGLGFQLITTWYDATASANDCSGGKQFNYGMSYITVHEFGADGTWYQIAGVPLSDTVLTGVTFAGTGLFVDGITNEGSPQSIGIGETFSSTQQIQNNASGDRYSRTTWTERLDL